MTHTNLKFVLYHLLALYLIFPPTSYGQSESDIYEELDIMGEGSPISLLFLLGGEYEKALSRLEKEIPEAKQIFGENSLNHIRLLHQQYLGYDLTGQHDQADRVDLVIRRKLHTLAEDSLYSFLAYKEYIDGNFLVTRMSGEMYKDGISLSDGLTKFLASRLLALDKRPIFLKMAYAAELAEKYEDDEEGGGTDMALEMIFVLFGKRNKASSDKTEKEEILLPPINGEEFEELLGNFESLSKKEKDKLEARLLQKLRHRNEEPTDIPKFTSHGDIYLQLARFYEARQVLEQANDYYINFGNALVEYASFLGNQFTSMAFEEDEEDTEDERAQAQIGRNVLQLQNMLYMASGVQQAFVMRNFYDAPHLAETSYDLALRDKAFVLERTRSIRQSAQQSDDPYMRKIVGLWLDYRNKQIALAQEGEDATAIKQRVGLLERELNRYAEELLQTKWQNVQEQLSPTEVAIEFVDFYGVPLYSERYKEKADPLSALDRDRQYAAIILRVGDPHPTFVPLCLQSKLDSLLQGDATKIAQQLYASRGAKPVGATPVGATPAEDDAGQQLYSLIWEPLEKYLQNMERIYYSPSGSLHQLSFAALPHPKGLLSNQYELWQLSSTREIGKPAPDEPKNVVLLGGVDYDVELDTKKRSSGSNFIDTRSLSSSYAYLPGTDREVKDITAMLKAQSFSTSLYTGGEAQEQVLNQLASPHILHIATHGFFLPDSARGLMLQVDQAMLRSGLLLAGANQSIQYPTRTTKYNDGILLAAEAAQLNLQQTQLVVLSACETGLGSTQSSEGVLGLQRAFREAGARYLIMSLWQVPDTPTQEMMSLFYQYWIADQLPIRQAFGRAQKDMQRQYAPHAWAGFVMVE